MPGLFILFLIAFALIALLGSVAMLLTIHRPRRKTFAVALALGCPTEPADLELQGEDAVFTFPDGHTSPGWMIRGQREGGPTVVILHGHRDSRYGALYRAKKLAPYAGHLVVFDWPAHGDCTAPWMMFGQREIEDLRSVIEGLPEGIVSAGPHGKPVLFGYSLGAQIAIKAAAEHPDRFAGVIADGPYRHWDSPLRARLKLMRIPAWPFVYPVGVFYLLRGYLPGFDRLGYARRLTVPLLVLHGTHDPICPYEEGKELAEAAPLGKFVSIEGGGHINLAGHDRETYHAALVQFFDGLPG